ncbi:S-layer homology domain-containing protein [Paenibacillus thermoaerophilus]|uniref:S-layer homology domain-containing protein n=1 Tax=Paenibacillus thermoaerophilus TaxID=1215385 RepID=A0ABW2V443_9BACL|nr:S-layer homology domain-containing protein [Paenibacillus thermoaerophilus]
MTHRNRWIGLVASLALALQAAWAPSRGHAAEQVTEYPAVPAAANAVIDQANPDRHYAKAHKSGGDGAYNIKPGNGTERIGYYQFAVDASRIPDDANRIYFSIKGKSNAAQGTVTLEVYGVTADGWASDGAFQDAVPESGSLLLTWNNAPVKPAAGGSGFEYAPGAQAIPLGTFAVQENKDGEALIDATQFVRQHGADGYVTFMVRGTEAKNVQIYNTFKTGSFPKPDGSGNIARTPSLTVRKVEDVAHAVKPYAIPASGVVASADDGNIAANTVDNNRYTRWSAQNSDGVKQTITYDLGETKPIGYVGIAFYNGDTRASMFDLLVSDDGETWREAAVGLTSSGASVQVEPFDLHGLHLNARYVRYVGHGNNSANASSRGWNSLTEFQVYPPHSEGRTVVVPVPDVEPERPPAAPFTKPGLYKPDGSAYTPHTPNPVTGVTLDLSDPKYGIDPADNGYDDLPGILAALAEAKYGDEVYFPDGVYNLVSMMPGDAQTHFQLINGVNLRGQSREGTILKSHMTGAGNSRVIKAFNKNNVKISNLTITSTFAGPYSTDTTKQNPGIGGFGNGIYIDQSGEKGSYNITIDNVLIEHFQRMGIRISKSRDITVRNSVFRNATDVGPGGAGYGITVQGTPKTDTLGLDTDTYFNLIENNRFEGPYIRHGVTVQYYAHNNLLRNNTFDGTLLDAIDLHGEDEYLNEVAYNTVANVPGGGIGVGNTGGTVPTNHDASGPGNYIHHNVITNAREGILVYMGSPDTVIEANTIEGTAELADAAGIKLLNAPGTIVRNNVIRGNTAPGFKGILLAHDNGDQRAGGVGAGDPSNITIEGNTVTGNTNGLIAEAGSGITITGNTIANNAVYNWRIGDAVELAESDLPSRQDPPPAAQQPSGPWIPSRPVFDADADGTVTIRHLPVTRRTSEGRSAASVTPGGEELLEALRLSAAGRGTGRVILAVGTEADAYEAVLTRTAIERLAESDAGAVLALDTRLGSYEMPLRLLRTLSDGGEAADVSLAIEPPTEETAAALERAAAEAGMRWTGIAADYMVRVGADGVARDYGTVYVTRTMPFAPGTNPANATVVRYDSATGRLFFVPGLIASREDGTAAAVFKRNGNSVYALIEGERTFADIAGHWARAEVEALASKLILNGVSESAFGPERAVTRAELAVMLVRSLGMDAAIASGREFADVAADDWFAGEVRLAAELGLADGFEDGTYRPDRAITREQMAALLVRAMRMLGAGGGSEAAGRRDLSAYADRHEVSAWAQAEVEAALRLGLMTGITDDRYAPGDAVTRAQAAVALKRLLVRLEFLPAH